MHCHSGRKVVTAVMVFVLKCRLGSVRWEYMQGLEEELLWGAFLPGGQQPENFIPRFTYSY
jgi:hypothetical protein